MKVLFLCNKSPYPPKEGGSLAMYNLITGLINKGTEVKVLAVNTAKNPIINEEIPTSFKASTQFESIFIDIIPHWADALKNLLTRKSYHIERFCNAELRNSLKKILQTDAYDIIQLESLYMAPYVSTIRQYSKGHIILRAHNIEHVIWERIAKNQQNIIKKLYLQIQSKRLKAYEIKMLDKYDGIAAITDVDKAFFEGITSIPIQTIPFGIESTIPLPKIDSKREEKGIFFLGSMNWMPNVEGIEWFLDKVWPQILQKDPTLYFYIAGRQAPASIKNYKKNNVVFVGEVENAMSFMSSKRIMVVPLFSGSGMRVKIIEGMMAGNAIVSTPIGAEGIDYTDHKNIVIADNSNAFAEAVLNCIHKPSLTQKIGQEAQVLVAAKYRNDIIIDKLIEFYDNINRDK